MEIRARPPIASIEAKEETAIIEPPQPLLASLLGSLPEGCSDVSGTTGSGIFSSTLVGIRATAPMFRLLARPVIEIGV